MHGVGEDRGERHEAVAVPAAQGLEVDLHAVGADVRRGPGELPCDALAVPGVTEERRADLGREVAERLRVVAHEELRPGTTAVGRVREVPHAVGHRLEPRPVLGQRDAVDADRRRLLGGRGDPVDRAGPGFGVGLDDRRARPGRGRAPGEHDARQDEDEDET